MNQLEQKTITSVEVAEMMEVNHFEVLRKLEGNTKVKGIIATMTDNKIVVSDYFTESTYQDASGKKNKCYLITKLGCDFLANKFTGEKGILFTAKYVKRFHEMEDSLQKPMTELEILNHSILVINQHDNRILKLENNMTIDHGQAQDLRQAGAKRIMELCGGRNSEAYKNLSKKMFAELWHDYKEYFHINSYANTLILKFNEGIDYVRQWTPSNNTLLSIRDSNAQLTLV